MLKLSAFKQNKGFTLVEMIVSLAIFSMVAVVATGALLTIVRSNQKARATKTVMENLSLAIDSMARSIRLGSNYHCGSTGVLTSPQNCTFPNGASFVAYQDASGVTKSFRLSGTSIVESDPTNGYSTTTSSDVSVTNLVFYVEEAVDPLAQARVKMTVQGYVNSGVGSSTRSDFSIQTTVSKRDPVY